jgi:Ca2+-binding EF-hand superfamily protein
MARAESKENHPEDDWLPQVVQKKPSKEAPTGEASRLARKYYMDLFEVKYILRLFTEADDNGSGGLDKQEFETILRKLFEIPASQKVEEKMLDLAWDKMMADGNGEASPDSFLEWYKNNMFTSMVREADSAGQPGAGLSYELAKKHGIEAPQVDKIQKRFEEFDVDGSGKIDYEEFLLMLVYVLKAKSAADISEDRAQRFWKEIDADGSGEIDFPEFVEWFVKYFNPDEQEMDLSNKGPVGKFYDSFNPMKARRINSKQSVSSN